MITIHTAITALMAGVASNAVGVLIAVLSVTMVTAAAPTNATTRPPAIG
jgi:hypothetical protein